jgi:hypothetical protein
VIKRFVEKLNQNSTMPLLKPKQRISYNSIRTSACDEEYEKRKERMNYGYHGQRESENVSKRTGKHPGRAFKPPWDFCTGRVEVGARSFP